MRNTITCFIIFLSPLLVAGQNKMSDSIPKRNTIYTELVGQGFWCSLSYNRLYRISKKNRTSFSAGLEVIQTKRYYSIFTPLKQLAYPEIKQLQ